MTTINDGEAERNQIENAYSYVRLSSKKQLRPGASGVERQTSKPDAICKANGWTLSPHTFRDLGVSAFSGANRLKGDLATFIKLAKDQKLLPSPVLILEQWDRFSRQDIDESEAAVMDLLKSGVALHIGFANKTFTKASTKNLADRIEIMLALKAAFEYSANLSRRVKDAKDRKLTKIANGEMANVSEMAPSWIDWHKATSSFVLNAKAPTTKSICDDYLLGKSLVSIVKRLNESGTKSFNNKIWYTATLRYILASRSVIGEFKGKSIFPKLLSTEDFTKIQAMLEANKNRRGHASHLVNIFRGMIRCTCGHTVFMTKNKGRNYANYRCVFSARGTCKQKRLFRSDLLERLVFMLVLSRTPDSFIRSEDTKSKDQLASLISRRDVLTTKIKTLLALDDNDGEEIKSQYQAFKAEREQVEKDITKLNGTLATIDGLPEAFNEFDSILENVRAGKDVNVTELEKRLVESLKDIDIRQRLQVLMPSIIGGIVINFNAQNFTVTLKNGVSAKVQAIKF